MSEFPLACWRRTFLHLLLLACLPVPIGAEESPGFADTRSKLVRLRIDRLAGEWLETEGVPGLVIALVKGGRPLLVKGYGTADVASRAPMDPDRTLVHASSLATPLTATAVLQLVDAGLLDLEADVNDALESLRVPPTYAEPVTARRILVHTAGFDSQIIARQVHDPQDLETLRDYLSARMPPRIRPPGQISVYSEHGYALAGLLVEDVSGVAFETYMQRNIFEPLDMHRSTFDWHRELDTKLATGYEMVGGELTPAPRDLRHAVPASMLATTAADASHWMLAVFNQGAFEGQRILSSESTSLMLSRQFSHHPSIVGRSFGLREGHHFESGEFFQLGTSSGFSSAVVLLPERRLGLFLAANGSVPIWGLIDSVLEPFVGRAGQSEPLDDSPFSDDSPRVAGFYREAGIPQTSIATLTGLIRQDRLVPSANGELVWRSHRYRPAEAPSLYRDVDTGEPLALLTGDSDTWHLALPWGVAQSVSWFDSRPVQLTLWILFATIFMAASAWPASRFPLRQDKLTPTDAFHPRWPFYCAWLAALFHLCFLITLAVTLAWVLGEGAKSLAFGVPLAVRLVLCLPLVGAALSLPALLGIAGAWHAKSWTFGHRLRLTLTVVALLAFLAFLELWNLLGFRF